MNFQFFNFQKQKLLIGFIFVFFIFSGINATIIAADFYFSYPSQNIYEGDIFAVDLNISSDNENINVVEGYLNFDKEKLEVKEITSGGSIFSLWLKPAIFSNETGEISFIGGTPNGFQGKNGKILKIIFLAKKEGEAIVELLDNSFVFLNDGYGTKTAFKKLPLKIAIFKKEVGIESKNEWKNILESDKNPPEFLETIVSQNEFVFGNKYFVSFFASDNESGVDYYEIAETEQETEDFSKLKWEKAQSPYLLKDQELKNYIYIKAVDKAGNEKIVLIKPRFLMKWYEKAENWAIIIIVIFILYLLGKGIKSKIKCKKSK